MIHTRGERNNNPMNIDRDGDKWQGLAVDQTDARFCVFTAPVWGIRAGAKLLLSYQYQHGLHTCKELIDRWAPPVENNTSAYVKAVASYVGCGATTPLHLQNEATLAALVKAIITHENGRCIYADSVVDQAVKKALGVA